jgi:hypothetical protein
MVPEEAARPKHAAYSPRCHMRSTVALITRIEIAANAIAENAVRYVLSMPAGGASRMPRVNGMSEGILTDGRQNAPAVRHDLAWIGTVAT